MNCRLGCGACCIAPSITSPILGMPNGKPAGVRCIQLTDDNLCKLFADPKRPQVCEEFSATMDVCGRHFDEAMWLISDLEEQTKTLD